MNNRSERGAFQGEGLTRREALVIIPKLAATALVAFTGCAKIGLPQGTGREGNINAQGIPEPQIDKKAALDASALYASIGVALLVLNRIIRR